MNGSYDSPYTNPRAPVHIVTGSAVSICTCIIILYVVYLYAVLSGVVCMYIRKASHVLDTYTVEPLYKDTLN